jgi:hypothetical protein
VLLCMTSNNQLMGKNELIEWKLSSIQIENIE